MLYQTTIEGAGSAGLNCMLEPRLLQLDPLLVLPSMTGCQSKTLSRLYESRDFGSDCALYLNLKAKQNKERGRAEPHIDETVTQDPPMPFDISATQRH